MLYLLSVFKFFMQDFIVLVSACVAYGTTFSQIQVMVTLANSFGIAFFVAYKFEKTDRLRWWSESWYVMCLFFVHLFSHPQ